MSRGKSESLRKDAKRIDASQFDGNFIKEAEPIYDSKGRKRRMVELLCLVCGTRFVKSLDNAKRVRQKTCSISCGSEITQKNDYKVMEHPLYWTWASMKGRCNNPNRSRYDNYGGRGISYAEEFESFHSFFEYVSSLPDYPFSETKRVVAGITMDRIDSNLGYVVGNIRWANVSVQNSNKKGNGTSSKYTGVCYCKTNKAWIGKVAYEGEIIFSCYEKTEDDAYQKRKEFIEKHNLPHYIEREL